MTIDIEFLLARHPRLFFGWKGRVEGFDRGDVLAAAGGGGRNVHPLFPVKRARHQLANKKCGRKIAVHDKADVLLFAAQKTASDVVRGIAEVDVPVIAHLPRRVKGMLDQHLAGEYYNTNLRIDQTGIG